MSGAKKTSGDERLTREIIKALRKVFDPEIPANVFDLGLIYDIDRADDGTIHVRMTLTAPNCPVAGQIMKNVEDAVKGVDGVPDCKAELVFDPPWTKDMMSEAVKLELGLL
ncbi:DUF59 domain-containing protein [Candidatus Sumerlaeota bacterium]|nr:DUF59 domain-containing protein [Candidatus Sumerlaeota bacterium]